MTTPQIFKLSAGSVWLHHSCRNYGLDTLVKLAGKNELVLLWIRNISDVLITTCIKVYHLLIQKREYQV